MFTACTFSTDNLDFYRVYLVLFNKVYENQLFISTLNPPTPTRTLTPIRKRYILDIIIIYHMLSKGLYDC